MPTSKSSNNLKILCGVVGDPIEHSLSPKIQNAFARQFNLNLAYHKYHVSSDNFSAFVSGFFEQGGRGLNITLPHKSSACQLAQNVSEDAKLCQSVNTLWRNSKGIICGDSTDGAGFVLDLERLNFSIANKNILVVGAGGAAKSIIYSLLKNKANLGLHNRSPEKINQLQNVFSSVGTITPFIQAQPEALAQADFDGVICALSEFNQTLYDPIIKHLKKDAFIYDLNYANRADTTLNYFKQKGFARCSDGYGMLCGQAAKSFEIWHGVLPEVRF